MFCKKCGNFNPPEAVFCTECGARIEENTQQGPEYNGYVKPVKSKVVAGLLALFLGGLGIHKFYLGYTQTGVIILVASIVGGLLTAGIANVIIGIVTLVEAIIYFTRSDYEFYQNYVVNKKEWF